MPLSASHLLTVKPGNDSPFTLVQALGTHALLLFAVLLGLLMSLATVVWWLAVCISSIE